MQSCCGHDGDIIIYQNSLHNTPEVFLFEREYFKQNPGKIIPFMVFIAFFMPLK